MSRSLPPVALALALVVAASGCTKAKSGGAVARLRQPSSVATFRGVTIESASAVRPYLAIANAARNDVSIVDATTNAPVMAPIELRPVVLPIENRPSLLAAASLGDDTSGARPDLLVAVAGGGSVLQVIETWDDLNGVHSDPHELPPPLFSLAVDLGHDVRALVPLPPDPSAPGSARIAALLADRRVAVVTYERGTDPARPDAIVRNAAPVVRATPLPFEPVAMAVMPDDPATPGLQANLYFATRDALTAPPTPPVYGVAVLPWDGLDGTPGVINASAPTRLVAAARLRERVATSASSGTDAFAPDAFARVYAVLDESACGPDKAIDCGVVTLDAGSAVPPDAAAFPVAIPADYSGLQRYRAPMRVPGRPLQLAVSGPPAVPLPADAVPGEPGYPAGFMRIFMGAIPRATTAVAAVASDDGGVYFLDLGRFETELNKSMLAEATGATPTTTKFGYPPQLDPMAPVPGVEAARRLWVEDAAGFVVPDTDKDRLLRAVKTTPGFTLPQQWNLQWEGTLPELSLVASEVARHETTADLALAMQVADRSGGGAPVLSHVVKLWHPALGIQKGDTVVIQASGMPAGCVGTLPLAAPGTPLQQARQPEFEVKVKALLPPTAAQPGGAVALEPVPQPDPGNPDARIAAWQACYDVLAANATSGVPGLRASIRAGGLLLKGSVLGYLGRPTLGVYYPVLYPGATREDELLTACPVADWDGSYPVATAAMATCDDACRTKCDELVVARKARRLQNMSVNCDTDPGSATECGRLWSATTPTTTGPALNVRVDVQRDPSAPPSATSAGAYRDMALTLVTTSAAAASTAKVSGTAPYEASAAIPFDRTPWTGRGDGYRFYVSYPADFVLEATPFLAGPYTNVIR